MVAAPAITAIKLFILIREIRMQFTLRTGASSLGQVPLLKVSKQRTIQTNNERLRRLQG